LVQKKERNTQIKNQFAQEKKKIKKVNLAVMVIFVAGVVVVFVVVTLFRYCVMVGACVGVVFEVLACVLAFVVVVVPAYEMRQSLKKRKTHTHGHKQHIYSKTDIYIYIYICDISSLQYERPITCSMEENLKKKVQTKGSIRTNNTHTNEP
jgi:hypothetical protein